MIVINVNERDVVTLNNEDYEIAKKMKADDKTLPFCLQENKIIFDDYIVGSIKINDTLINIIPRHECISLFNVFEMILYTDFDFFMEKSDGYDFSEENGVYIVPTFFLDKCLNLVSYGITGGYQTIIDRSRSISGKIIFENYNKKLIPFQGLDSEKSFYSNNVIANRIIKTALNKIGIITPDNLKIKKILSHFEDVEECGNEFLTFNPDSFFSSNPYYKECLSIAITILKDLRITFNGNKIEWLSFLKNSNDLFEKYARKLVKVAIDLPVEKWKEPKDFACIEVNGVKGYKSYTPDILINYNKNTETSFAVLDVKNKEFKIQNSNLADLIQSADLYQMLFYSSRLKVNLCGLIYPTNISFDPVRVIVPDKKDLSLYLLSINMNLPQQKRLEKLKSDMNKYFFRNC